MEENAEQSAGVTESGPGAHVTGSGSGEGRWLRI
jgi:hypothetical protein